jgi:cell division protein FtsB
MPRLRWMFIAALATLLFFIAATVYYFEFQKLTRLKFAVAEGSARLFEKERNVINYREKVAFYKTDEGIAHLAREQYNLAFPGERVYTIERTSSE